MEDHGIEPRVATYTAVMNAWGRAGDVVRPAKWLQTMLDKGMTPNAVTFSAMIDACAKASDCVGAELWHNRMVEAGIEASNHEVVGVIDACSKADDAGRAERVFQRMRSKGITPNIVTYSTLARPFARSGDWWKVEELEAQLRADGLKMNEYFLYTLLDAYCSAEPQQPERAEKAFRHAVQLGVRLNDHIKGKLFKILGSVAAQHVLADCKQCEWEARRQPSQQKMDLAALRLRGRA